MKPGPKKGEKHSGQFKAGVSGNPGGSKKLPDDLKHLMFSTGLQVKRDLYECYNTRLSTLRALATKEDEVHAGLAMIASCMVNACDTGDNRILATFLDRILGRPKETVELTDSNDEKINEKDETINQLVQMITDKK